MLNYTLSRPRQIKIKAKVSATFCHKGAIYMETRDKLMSLTQSDKTQQWLMNKSSNQRCSTIAATIQSAA